jgi:glycosyltransferase involved in cell wall biosynthesis
MIGFFNSFGLSREYAYKIYENFPKKAKENIKFFNFHSTKVNRDYVSNIDAVAFPILKQRLNELFCFSRRTPSDLELYHFTNQGMANFLNKKRKNQIITVHDLTPFYFERYSFLKKYFLRKIKLADKVIAISESTKKDVSKLLKVPGYKIHVIPNGVDTDVFRPLRVNKEDFILNVGTDEPRKNISNLLILFRELQRAKPNLKLLRIGGCSRASLRYIRKNNLNVIFMNNLSQGDLAKIYNKARFYLTTSLYEGFGLPLVEAMACGCPVVASSTEIHREVLGDVGFFINQQDTKESAKICLDLLNNKRKHNKKISRSLGRAKKFSWKRNASKTLKLYMEILS